MTTPRIPDPAEVERSLDDAMAAALAGRAEMVNRWVALVEVVDGDGRRGVWTFTSPDLMRWESLGLLQYGLMAEQTLDVAEQLSGE